jgi:L-fucose mutarotase
MSPLITPDLLSTLYRMGHGDEILLANAHFPAETHNRRVLRVDGVSIEKLLAAIIPLFELDAYVDHPIKMTAPIGEEVLCYQRNKKNQSSFFNKSVTPSD